jgi:hypothetical protein
MDSGMRLPSDSGRLTREPQAEGAYSASAVFPDATLARWDKVRAVAQAMAAGILNDIENLRGEPVAST